MSDIKNPAGYPVSNYGLAPRPHAYSLAGYPVDFISGPSLFSTFRIQILIFIDGSKNHYITVVVARIRINNSFQKSIYKYDVRKPGFTVLPLLDPDQSQSWIKIQNSFNCRRRSQDPDPLLDSSELDLDRYIRDITRSQALT